MTNGSDREQFAVNIVWHPEYASGSNIASGLKKLWATGPYREVLGEAGVNVCCRYSTVRGSPLPQPIDWEGSDAMAVVVLLDRSLATQRNWMKYVQELEQQANARGYANRVFPVAMEADVLDAIGTQAIRWDDWSGDCMERTARLKRELTHQFCMMLRYSLDSGTAPMVDGDAELRRYDDTKIRIFISHATGDDWGRTTAQRIREWAHQNSDMRTFFADVDIPRGVSFRDAIHEAIPDCAMVACYSDSFSSREWCRREVIVAKKCGVPMLVLDCLRGTDDRVFPYLGNVPMMRVASTEDSRMEEIVSRLLDEVFRDLLWRHRVAPLRQRHADVAFTVRRPELFTVATLSPANGKRAPIVYPGSPIGEEETELFDCIDPSIRLHTIDDWYVRHRS